MSSEVSERAKELLSLNEIEAEVSRLMQEAAGKRGMTVSDWVSARMAAAAEEARASEAALSSPPIDDGVTQEDREAAAARLERSAKAWPSHPAHQTARMIRDGKMDCHHWVQEFARHRIAAAGDVRRRTIEECARVAERHIVRGLSDFDRGGDVASCDIAKAIRSLSAKEESR